MRRRAFVKQLGGITFAVGLAGCAGSENSRDEESTAKRTTTENTNSQEYPPGISDETVANARDLSREHLSRLTEAGFTVDINYRRKQITSKGTVAKRCITTEVAQAVSDHQFSSSYSVFGDLLPAPVTHGGVFRKYDVEQYGTANALYVKSQGEVRQRENDQIPQQYTFYEDIASKFDAVEVVARESGDEPHFWLVASLPATEGSESAPGYTPRRLYGVVKSTGVFEALSGSFVKTVTRREKEFTDQVDVDVSFRNVGTTSLKQPEWVPN